MDSRNQLDDRFEAFRRERTQAAGQRMQSEVDEFLLDARFRLNEFVDAIMQQRGDSTHPKAAD